MGKPRIFSEEEKKNILEKYQKGVSMSQLAKEYHAGKTTLMNLFDNEGWHRRGIQEANGKSLTEEQIEILIYNYVILGKGLIPSGQAVGASQRMVEKSLKERGIKLRTYVESKDNLRKYSVNDDFFKTQSHDMAYVLGLLASDGNIAKAENQVSIQLHQGDAEVLEKINVCVQNTRPIVYYTTSEGHEKAKFSTFSSAWKRDLAHYSVVPNKTKILEPPLLLNKKYWSSYILGYFDGDGSCGKYGYSPSWDICGASKKVLEWIREVLANEYGITNNGLYTSTLSNGLLFYRTVYYGKDKLKKLYDALYISDSLFMKRKKEKMQSLVI